MLSRTIEQLANHEGHVLNLVKAGERMLLECMTCQEVVLVLGEDKDTEKLELIVEGE